MKHLVIFNASSDKSKNLHFVVLLLSILHKFWAKKLQKNYLSLYWSVIQTLMKNWVFVWKMTWGIWGILTRAVESLKIFTLVGYFCRKYVIFELKKYKVVVPWKVTYGLKWHKKFGEFSQLKSMLDKSSLYNVLVEGMYFFDKSRLSKFNFLNFPLLFWSCPNSSCDFETSSQFLYKLCTIV